MSHHSIEPSLIHPRARPECRDRGRSTRRRAPIMSRTSLVLDPAGGGGEFGPEKLNRSAPFKELYKVGKVIGEGAFGTVRLVTHRAENTKWAVKIIEKLSLIHI